jgi:hypothetical protein
LKAKFLKSIKIIALTVAISICPMIVFAQMPVKNLDGIYTLKQIETPTGQIKTFDYGGELTVKNNIATLKTNSQQATWNLKGLECEIIDNHFYQIDPKTNEKYIFEKVK